MGGKTKRIPGWLRWAFNPKVGYPLLALIFLVNIFLQKQDYIDKKDHPRIIANYLSKKLEDGDQIYTGNYAQIIYHLLDRTSPIKYIHPSLFWEAHHITALEMKVDEEVEKIRKANPRFILVRNELNDHRLDTFLKERYQIAKVFEEKGVKVYERKR